MAQEIMTALGGLGLFLVGMVLMTDGLRELAGRALNRWLAGFTRSPATGALTGTVATAVLQSSSTTTVATVGFVAAGLLTFPQALGIIFGANLGTTVTGWMVALFGFKLEFGRLALPLVLVGALSTLLGRGPWRLAGRVIAGFAVLMIGIEFMKNGMAGFGALLTPDSFPPDDLGSRLLLVGIGALLTLVTQSSSAGVALAMTALSLGALSFPQAASMVIGMDVGTSVTAVLASLGHSNAARRTGLSHTIFNVFTAVIALVLLDGYVAGLNALSPGAVETHQELALVGFHTLFNLAALLLGLPLVWPFTRLMTWLVPDRSRRLTHRLDDALLVEPSAANTAMAASLREAFSVLLRWLRQVLGPRGSAPFPEGETVEQDLRDIRAYLDRLNALPDPGSPALPVADAIHALDHLRRMNMRLEQGGRLTAVRQLDELAADREALLDVTEVLLGELPGELSREGCSAAQALARRLADGAAAYRDQVISRTADHDLSVQETGDHLAASRWLQRMAQHQWRVAAHLAQLKPGEPPVD